MSRRAFTMIELMIVMGIMVVVEAPFLAMFVGMEREFARLAGEADLKARSQGMAAAVLRHAAASAGRYRLESDNHGLRFGDASAARWDGKDLACAGRRLGQAQDFSVVRAGPDLLLTLQLEGYRAVYRWSPRQGLRW